MLAILTSKVFLTAAGAFALGLIDLIFALNPKAQANGFMHWVYLALTSSQAQPAAVVAPAQAQPASPAN